MCFILSRNRDQAAWVIFPKGWNPSCSNQSQFFMSRPVTVSLLFLVGYGYFEEKERVENDTCAFDEVPSTGSYANICSRGLRFGACKNGA